MPIAGALYRMPPRGFDDLFISVGWGSIEADTQAHAKTIAKWLNLRNAQRIAQGLPSLQEARAAYVREHGQAPAFCRVTHLATPAMPTQCSATQRS
jgi:hypothetical protein